MTQMRYQAKAVRCYRSIALEVFKMAYVGERLKQTFHSNFFRIFPSDIFLILILPDKLFPNPCGHVLLEVKGKIGNFEDVYFFHVPGFQKEGQYYGLYDVPHMMNSIQFKRYLRENDKREEQIKRIWVPSITKNAAETMSNKIQSLLANDSIYWGIIRNCQSFVEEILISGGVKFIDFTTSDCPKFDIPIFEKQFIRYVFDK